MAETYADLVRRAIVADMLRYTDGEEIEVDREATERLHTLADLLGRITPELAGYLIDGAAPPLELAEAIRALAAGPSAEVGDE